MKFTPDRKLTTAAHCACAVSAASIAGITLLFGYSTVGHFLKSAVHILEPIIVGFIIAYLFNPMMKRIEGLVSRLTDKKKERPVLRRVISLIAVYLLYSVILTVILLLVVPQVISSCNDLIDRFDGYILKFESLLSGLSSKFPFINSKRIISLTQKIADNSSELISKLIPRLTTSVSAFAGYVKNALLGIVLSVYFLYSKEMLAKQFKRIVYAIFSKKNSGRADSFMSFLRTSDMTFGGFITGKLLDSLIIGILTFIILIIFRIPYSSLVAVIVGITNIIPFFGPLIGAVPSVFIILIAEPVKALWFIIIIIVIQQLDGNVIGPMIIGESTGLSSLGVMAAITIMGGLMGIPGMFIGVPLFALIYMLLKRLLTFIESKRKISAESSNAAGDDKSAEKEAENK